MPAFAAQFLRLIRQSIPNYEPPVVGMGFASIAADFESVFSRKVLAEQVKTLLELPHMPAHPGALHISQIVPEPGSPAPSLPPASEPTRRRRSGGRCTPPSRRTRETC